jgi:hypothetical protein
MQNLRVANRCIRNAAVPIICFLVSLLLQGCVADIVMKSQDRQHYSDYVTETQRLNLEREKAGLAPTKILTFEEWSGRK